jgi:hypothetical protein
VIRRTLVWCEAAMPAVVLQCFQLGDQIDNQRHQIPVGHSTASGVTGSSDRMREWQNLRQRLRPCPATRLPYRPTQVVDPP